MAGEQPAWEFWIDRGGTFTDVIAHRPGRAPITRKLLSENPSAYADAALHGIEQILGERDPATRAVQRVRMGTTVATNALLERTGDATALVVTRGLEDVLRIGYQTRPQLFARHIVLPAPLYGWVIGMDERFGPDGKVERALDTDALAAALSRARDEGARAVAIVGLHGYRFPAHEQLAARIARDVGYEQISTSHEVMPVQRMVPRGDTTVADAYLSPTLRRYVDRVRDSLRGVRLEFMQSNGGLVEADAFRGSDAVLSGPAGGIVGAVAAANLEDITRLVSFDMGGTSTDVAFYSGEIERTRETEIAGTRLCVPMLAISTIAAGGGSVCTWRQGRFAVGPESAGAHPGPAGYGSGGPLTVTDCQLALGRLQPDLFPQVFGPQQNAPLDLAAAERAIAAFAAERPEGDPPTAEAVAAGMIRVAVAAMARAIKTISVQRGEDLSDATLVAFGGAGGQHACAIADELEMAGVLIPAHAGLLSAKGIGRARVRLLKRRSCVAPLTDSGWKRVAARMADLDRAVRASLTAQGVSPDHVRLDQRVALRTRGAEAVIEVPFADPGETSTAFERLHVQRYGFAPKQAEVAEVVVEGVDAEPERSEPGIESAPASRLEPAASHRVYFGAWLDTPFYRRASLPVDRRISGPAVIVDDGSTTVVEPNWSARRTANDQLLLERSAPPGRERAGERCDPVRLEVFNGAFMSVAEQMGHVLRHTAVSVNIRERLDFSCAVFDRRGALIANAPHMPVHLGSMGESVRAVMDGFAGNFEPGDAYVLNDPYVGGTHLPDITVVSPVFDQNEVRFFVASRGHHADVGGVSPGSMPAHSRHIDEEGVLIGPSPLVKGGVVLRDDMLQRLRDAKYPARAPDRNLADLEAQVAANQRGKTELLRLIERYGWATVDAYTRHVCDNAEAAVRDVIGALADGEFRYELDDGSAIQVAVAVDHRARRAVVDFAGTSDGHPGNFNAPYAVVRAAVLYVFRTLVDAPIPMNEGCLQPLDIQVPEGCMLRPQYPAAVAAGNVETSQVIVDCLYGALGALAASQGTMNNVTFGGADFQYYETVCGGAGAGPEGVGASAVHTHMTNSRLTDPEVLEARFPVRVDQFAVRRGSGGQGRWPGGDGVTRRLRFTAPVTLSLLANRHRVAPFGLAGGDDAAPGAAYVERASGERRALGSTDTVDLQAGDVFVLATPGGGGFGPPEQPES